MALNEPECTLRGKLRLTYSRREFLRSTGRMFLDTETSGLLTGAPLNLLTCSAVDSPVKTSVLPASEPGLTGNGQDYGVNMSEPFAHFDHATCSWRTYQVSLLTLTWDEYSETWPRAGTMRNGIVFQQVPLAPLTVETGYGLLPTEIFPTPIASEAGKSPKTMEMVVAGKCQMTLDRYVKLWPTPTVDDASNCVGKSRVNNMLKGQYQGLNAFVVTALKEQHGTLNPQWVEWLQGYPPNWTEV